MSKDGEKMLANMQNEFMNLYADVFKDIEKNDLVNEGASYLANKKIVSDSETFLKWQLVFSSFIAYLLSITIYFVIIPLFTSSFLASSPVPILLAQLSEKSIKAFSAFFKGILSSRKISSTQQIAYFLECMLP